MNLTDLLILAQARDAPFLCASTSIIFFSTLYYAKGTPTIWRGLSRQGRRDGKGRVHKLRDSPSPIRNAQRLRWRCAQCLMGAAEIVMRNIQRDGRNVIIKLFGETIG